MLNNMMKIFGLTTASILALQSPVMAQDNAASTSAVAAVEPGTAELKAAAEVIDLIMPPAQRQQMVDAMVRSMMQNMTSGIVQSPELQEAFKEYPAMQDVFKDFIEREENKALQLMQDSMPEMITAMTRAYARNFTVAQLSELNVFFASPTGQVYAAKSATIMSDPDVARWQREMTARSMEDMPSTMEKLMAELMAVTKEASDD